MSRKGSCPVTSVNFQSGSGGGFFSDSVCKVDSGGASFFSSSSIFVSGEEKNKGEKKLGDAKNGEKKPRYALARDNQKGEKKGGLLLDRKKDLLVILYSCI